MGLPLIRISHNSLLMRCLPVPFIFHYAGIAQRGMQSLAVVLSQSMISSLAWRREAKLLRCIRSLFNEANSVSLHAFVPAASLAVHGAANAAALQQRLEIGTANTGCLCRCRR